MRCTVVVLAFILLLASAAADDVGPGLTGTSDAEAAASAVVASTLASDTAELTALAARSDPDPWIVVEELCAQGEQFAAEQFAAAVPSERGDALVGYVAWRGEHPMRPGAKAALEAATAALEAREHDVVLGQALDAADGVTGARLAFTHGIALRRLRRFAEAADTLVGAAGDARELGWLAPGPYWLEIAASFHAAGGDLPSATLVLEQRVELCRMIGDEQLLSDAFTSLGQLRGNAGEYGAARDLIEAALEIRRDAGGPRYLASQLDLAWIHMSLGDRARALEAQNRVLALAREAGDPRLLYRALNETGCTLKRLGKRREGIAYTLEALEIAETLGDEPSIATLLANVGGDYIGLGEYETALRYCREALTRMSRLQDHRGIARTLGNMAGIHNKRGEPQKAIPLWQQGMVRALRSGHADMAGWCMWGLAGSYRESGNDVMASRLYRQLVAAGRRLLHGLSFDEVMRAREQAAGIFASGYCAARDAGRLDDVCYFLETGRADSLITALGDADALRAADIPEELAQEEQRLREAEDAARRAHRAALARGARRDVAAAERTLAEAHEALTSVVERIDRIRRGAVEDLLPEPATTARMRDNLAEGEALLLYGLAEETSLALVVTGDGARLVDLAGVREIMAALDALVAASASQAGDATLLAGTLRRLLIDPLELGPDVRRLLVSPYRWLARIPLGLVGGGRDICFVPSGTTWVLLTEAREVRGEEVLAFGSPEYGSEGVREAARTRWGDDLVDLPATRDEVEAVGDRVLLGPEATETAFRRLAAEEDRWRAVHFACHALVDTEHPSRSVLAITADEENDGFISALDVVRMDIRADLVVLSACETGRGRIYGTEGLVGLTRAFMFAGAPRVLCSLWPVDDEATQALMTKFYELWNPEGTLSERSESNGSETEGTLSERSGMGAAAALREAQAHVRSHEKWRHPHYWAAWVLWGLPD